MILSMTENGFKTSTHFGELEISGKDEGGFKPCQLLVLSIASCSGLSLRNVLEKMRMPASNITVEVKEIIRNENVANRLEKIHLHIIIEGHIKETKITRAMDLATKNCSIVQSVNNNIDVIKTFELR